MISYGLLSELDVNLNKDIVSDDPRATCAWFTVFVGTTVHTDEGGIERLYYEYVSFPATTKDGTHVLSVSSPQPYYPGMVVHV